MAVSGHIPVLPSGVSLSFLEGAEKEMAEEIGLTAKDLIGGLVEVGKPYTSFETRGSDDPPFYNLEVRQIFVGIISREGMSRLRPDDEELGGIYACTPQEAWRMLEHDPIAGGMRYSLPRFLDWLAQQK